MLDALPRFPKVKPQRDIAGRNYLTKTEINSLYFATHQMKRPAVGLTRFRSVVTGELRWSCSSITASIMRTSGLCGVNEIRRSIAETHLRSSST